MHPTGIPRPYPTRGGAPLSLPSVVVGAPPVSPERRGGRPHVPLERRGGRVRLVGGARPCDPFQGRSGFHVACWFPWLLRRRESQSRRVTGVLLPMLCPIAPVQASKPLWPVVWGSEVTGLSALTHYRIGAERAARARCGPQCGTVATRYGFGVLISRYTGSLSKARRLILT
jgi:hypothetical protein